MIFDISHLTRYRFTKPVFLEPHTLRLRPKEDPSQKMLAWQLALSPAKPMSSGQTDAEGNPEIRFWTAGEHDFLEVVAQSRVETLRQNPFEFLLDAEAVRLPFQVLDQHPGLRACLHIQNREPELEAFAQDLCARVQGDTLSFLGALNSGFFQGFEKQTRPQGAAWPALETFHRKQGSCRDLSVLFIDICRYAGIPTRYTSGYYFGGPKRKEYDLHAWPEVYLPGAGWRGYDPSAGLAVADWHVALTSSWNPALTSPVEGGFRHNGAESSLETTIYCRLTENVATPPGQ